MNRKHCSIDMEAQNIYGEWGKFFPRKFFPIIQAEEHPNENSDENIIDRILKHLIVSDISDNVNISEEVLKYMYQISLYLHLQEQSKQ